MKSMYEYICERVLNEQRTSLIQIVQLTLYNLTENNKTALEEFVKEHSGPDNDNTSTQIVSGTDQDFIINCDFTISGLNELKNILSGDVKYANPTFQDLTDDQNAKLEKWCEMNGKEDFTVNKNKTVIFSYFTINELKEIIKVLSNLL